MVGCVKALLGAGLAGFFLLTAGCGNGDAGLGGNAGFRVAAVVPEPNEQLESMEQPLAIVFSQDVDPLTLTAQSVRVMDLTNHEVVPGKVSYDAGSRTATFSPLSGWTANGHYKATVHHRVQSSQGAKHLPASLSWEFDAPPKQAESGHVAPSEDETDVNPKTEIAVQFWEAMDATTITSSTFQLIDPTGAVVPATVIAPLNGAIGHGSGHDPYMPMPPPFGGATREGDHAILNPTNPLALGTVYKVRLTTGIRSLRNGAFGGKEWSFTTASAVSSTLLIGSDQGDDIAAVASNAGDVYVLGNTQGAITSETKLGEQDLFVTKRSPAGQEIWTKQFGTPAYDMARGLAVDASGNSYVLAMSDPSVVLSPPPQPGTIAPPQLQPVGQAKGFIYKLSPTKEILKSVDLGGASSYVAFERIAMDNGGNVYVAGFFDGTFGEYTSVGGPDAFLAKYNSNLDRIWFMAKGTAGGESSPRIALGQDGSIYWGLSTDGDFSAPTKKPETYASKAVVFKLADAATPTTVAGWPVTISGAAGRYLAGIGLDGVGNLYVGGSSQGDFRFGPGSSDGFLAKLNSQNGSHSDPLQWGTTEPDDYNSMIVQPDGSVYLAGVTQVAGQPVNTPGGGTYQEWISVPIITKIDALANSQVWTKKLPAKEHASADALVLSAAGELVVVGSAHGSFDGQITAGPGDGFFARLNPADGTVK